MAATARKRSLREGNFCRPQTKFGSRSVKVMFLLLSVILFTEEGVCVCPIACWDTHPLGRHPSGQTPPPSDITGFGQQTGGTHTTQTTGMHTCFTGVCPSVILSTGVISNASCDMPHNGVPLPPTSDLRTYSHPWE